MVVRKTLRSSKKQETNENCPVSSAHATGIRILNHHEALGMQFIGDSKRAPILTKNCSKRQFAVEYGSMSPPDVVFGSDTADFHWITFEYLIERR